jgi:hypothetical protein
MIGRTGLEDDPDLGPLPETVFPLDVIHDVPILGMIGPVPPQFEDEPAFDRF